MTKNTLMLFAFLALQPTLASAQSVKILSGEHGAFTRLVFNLPVIRNWQLEEFPEKDGYSLTFDGPRIQFDISEVFIKIDRNRIRAIDIHKDGLGFDIELSCICTIDAYRFKTAYLVLDVSDLRPASTISTVTGDAKDADSTSLTQVTLRPVPRLGPTPKRLSFFSLFPDPPKAEPTTTETPSLALSAQQRKSALSRDIAQSLADAATRGLLVAIPRDNQIKPPEVVADEAYVQLAEGNQRISTEVMLTDKFGLATVDRGHVRVGGSSCVGKDELDIQSWASDQPLSVQISQARQALTGEFDRIDAKVVDRLTKLYLHFGFGAEANSTQTLSDIAKDPILTELGRILDGREELSGAFAGQTDCETSASMWAVLAEDGPLSGPLNRAAVLRAFEDLPSHLRSHLGPRLADKLVTFGETDAAAAVLMRLQRAGGEQTANMRLSQARIDMKEGALDTAQSNLRELARNGDDIAPEAVAAISNLSTERDQKLPEDIAEIADAYATELRGTPTGNDLWLARLRGWADTGRFSDAFAMVKSAKDIAEDIREQGHDDLVSALVKDASDIAFLKHALNGDSDPVLNRIHSLALDASARLLTLGVPDRAVSILKAQPDRRVRRTRLLAARAFLDLGRADQAEIELVGLDGEDVLQLRANARIMMGDYDYAQFALSALGDLETALDAAWISGDLQTIADADRGAVSDASRLALRDVQDFDPMANPTLIAASTLANNSESVRATLGALLSETRIYQAEISDGE